MVADEAASRVARLAGLPTRSERGLCPRNRSWGEVRMGGEAPRRVIFRPHGLLGERTPEKI